MMRIFLLIALCVWLHAMDHLSNIALTYINYNTYKDEILLQGDTKLTLDNELFSTFIKLEYLYSQRYKERREALVNEFYISKEFESYSLLFGKVIQFSGELEGYNIADIYNQKNYSNDPFDKSKKIGAPFFILTNYFDTATLQTLIKFYEQNQNLPTDASPYALFSLSYEETLETSDKKYTPTLYINYKLNETQLSWMHGYDTKRYFFFNDEQKLSQYAYRVNKLLLTSNIIYEDFIFKFENSYTNSIKDTNMGDYAQITFGLEKSFFDIDGYDLSLFLEYYRYLYLQESIKNIDIAEIYDNDIFMAWRLAFNDVHSTQIKVALLQDIEKNEQLMKFEASTRLFDTLTLSTSYIKTKPNDSSVLESFGALERFNFSLAYTF